MAELIVNLLLLVCGMVIGYYVGRGPRYIETFERVRVERVSVPHVVEKVVETVRVEYIEKPVIVDRPSLVEVERERIVEVEKPVVQVERVPVSASTLAMAAVPVSIVLMDASESRIQATETMDARLRRPMLQRGECRYACVRQAENGDWIYRQVA